MLPENYHQQVRDRCPVPGAADTHHTDVLICEGIWVADGSCLVPMEFCCLHADRINEQRPPDIDRSARYSVSTLQDLSLSQRLF